ncbi:phosphatidylglycerophosphatase A [Phocaeicola acetigenes]|jgi:phosphatidylglycerophosphatase A|uniref:Phosphatidylglycerophosphatase A n=1 Tax=Phocaeicola acetigenes TaxID=3016083 RepID=A0ABT4PIK7_9BACT|nr:phosphatidylglycerophosphatase A [Phocaeicola sp. KGMB11183]MCZ8372885.1 phosphatidylglycerophosphatase A [Phocaeicola sp. KGMB11183]
MPKAPLFHNFIATGFGSGYSPIAPGTAGALLAMLIWWGYSLLFSHCISIPVLTFIVIVVFTFAGVWSSSVVEKYWGEDPSRVVVDEMVGTWIALLAVPEGAHWGYMLAAFVLFRFFDIVKPLGVRKMESLPSGFGIMADDILAGIYGFIVIYLYRLCFA